MNEHLFEGDLASIPSEEDDDLQPRGKRSNVPSSLKNEAGGDLPVANPAESLNKEDDTRVNVIIKNKPIELEE